MHRLRPVLATVLVALSVGLAGCNQLESIANADPDDLDDVARARFELGHDLFFDRGLSGAGDVSCASCHVPELFGADALPVSEGTGGQLGRRNAPSVFNAALRRKQFWDGRADSLEAQAREPLFAPDEMGQTEAGLLEHVSREYADRFAAAFPGEFSATQGPSVAQVTLALAAYQALLPRRSRLDSYLDGDRDAFDRQERRGYRLFRNNCAFCHEGPAVGGTMFEKLGADTPWPKHRRDDLGRYEVTGDPDHRMEFFVPSLRNVAQTAPYFHDGSVETLEEAVKLMGRHQIGRDFTGPQTRALVAFLETLDAKELPPWAYEDWTPQSVP